MSLLLTIRSVAGNTAGTLHSRRLNLAQLTLGTLLLCGCYGDRVQIAEVSGKVTYQDAPLPAGTVFFVSETGFASACEIATDGTFWIQSQYGKGIPPGEYKVAIEVPGPENIDPADPDRDAKIKRAKGVKIPRFYADPAQSGLTATIQSGANDLTFSLVSR